MQPSIDRSVFFRNEDGLLVTLPYFHPSQRLYAVSLGWNAFGGQRDNPTRIQDLVQQHQNRSHADQLDLWKQHNATARKVRALALTGDEQYEDVVKHLQNLGVSPPSRRHYRRLLKRIVDSVVTQNAQAKRGRYYAVPPSKPVELAIMMILCGRDALTGAHIAVKDMSCDACVIFSDRDALLISFSYSILSNYGHNIFFSIPTSKYNNYLKATWYFTYTDVAMKEWLNNSQQGRGITERLGEDASFMQYVGELLWETHDAFLTGALTTAGRL